MNRLDNFISRIIPKYRKKDDYYKDCEDGSKVPDPEKIYKLLDSNESKLKLGVTTSIDQNFVPNFGVNIEKESQSPLPDTKPTRIELYDTLLRHAITRYALMICRDKLAVDRLYKDIEKIEEQITEYLNRE